MSGRRGSLGRLAGLAAAPFAKVKPPECTCTVRAVAQNFGRFDIDGGDFPSVQDRQTYGRDSRGCPLHDIFFGRRIK